MIVLIPFKTLRQAAALPYVWTPHGVEVALITSKGGKRWIIPKGWPEKQLSLRETAALEALEEAGIEGILAGEPAGSFVYEKKRKGYSVPCRVFVFPLLACTQQLDWKEREKRKVKWYPIAAAAERAEDQGLAWLLAGLAKAPERLADLTAT